MILNATLAMLLALAAALLARRATAATRHAILVAGQLAALVVPLLGAIVPPVAVPMSEPRLERVIAATRGTAGSAPAALPARATNRIEIDPIVAVWLAGCAAVIALRARSLVRAIRIARRARPWNDVFVSDEIDQPLTLGARILLPAAAPLWDAAQRDAVLLHERAHVARRDSLLGVAGDVVCAAYWFHPLAWLLSRRARLERERACDEAVLAQGVRGSDYASVLLAIARTATRRAHGMPMAARSDLEARIRTILRGAAKHPRRGARAIVGVAALVIAPLVAALTPLAIPRPSSGEPDLLGDAVALPWSEWIGAPAVQVAATGADADLIAEMQTVAARERRADDDFVPDRARWALSRVRGGELVVPLLESLRDRDWRVRAYAAWSLGMARDRRATAALVPLLRDPIWRMRAMAAYALAEIADPAAHEAMRDVLGDPAWQVRSEAVRYLGALRDPADRELLRAMRADRHIAVRGAAEEATQ